MRRRKTIKEAWRQPIYVSIEWVMLTAALMFVFFVLPALEVAP